MNSIHRRLLVINLDNPELLEEGAVMTENEAKVFIQNAMEQSRNALAELMLIMPKVFAVMEKNLGEYYSNLENCKKEIQACEVAIKTLEEVQQYHAIGTPEECLRNKDFLDFISDKMNPDDFETYLRLYNALEEKGCEE